MRPTLCILSTTSRLRKPAPPSLDHFIQRQRVLALWRDILRSLYRNMSNPQRAETVAYVRGEFDRNREVADIGKIRYLLSTGRAEWEGMRRGVEDMGVGSGRR